MGASWDKAIKVYFCYALSSSNTSFHLYLKAQSEVKPCLRMNKILSSACPSLHTLLGLHLLKEKLPLVTALGQTMTKNAEKGDREPRCAWDSSGLTLEHSDSPSPVCVNLLIDVGGTHTKAALLDHTLEWRFLLDHSNDWFQDSTPSGELPLTQFLRKLFTLITKAAPELLKSSYPLRVGVVWSNQMATCPIERDGCCGISGVVQGAGLGGYRKGEWFLAGLNNGDDIGDLFFDALTEAQLRASVLVLGNDTIFTLFATPNAHAGMVVSSGGNCTLLGLNSEGRESIYNSEIGGMLILPSEALSRGDLLFAGNRPRNQVALEELCAGKWFADLVAAHVRAASELTQHSDFAPLARKIASNEMSLSNAAISALLSDPNQSIPSLDEIPTASRLALYQLAQALVERGGMLAGVLAYLSIWRPIERGAKNVTISVDSSMARHMPGFRDAMTHWVNALIPPGTQCELNLVKPFQLHTGDEIPVPMLGVARALKEYPITNRGKIMAVAGCN